MVTVEEVVVEVVNVVTVLETWTQAPLLPTWKPLAQLEQARVFGLAEIQLAGS
jgi:hypothetical protein